MLVFLASIVLCAFLNRTVPEVGSQTSSTPVYFHANNPRSDLSLFGLTGSERLYAPAVDMNYPVTFSSTVASMSAELPASKVTALIPGVPTTDPLGRTVYIGYVAWLLPIQSDVQVDGEVRISVWMSSNDNPGFLGGTGYFFAIADVNPQNPGDSSFRNLKYDGSESSGNILGATPKLVSTTDFGRSFMIVNHHFAAGRSLAFFAGAGSAKQGWQFQVYFDSTATPAGATVPSTLFSNATVQQPTTVSGCSISVSLTANPTGGSAPLTVTFYASVFGANGAVQYDWWFGDGAHITGNPSMTYTYPDPWKYSVVVSVLDAKGCWSKTGTIVTVTPKNVPEFPASAMLIMTIATMMTVVALRFSKRRDYSCRRE